MFTDIDEMSWFTEQISACKQNRRGKTNWVRFYCIWCTDSFLSTFFKFKLYTTYSYRIGDPIRQILEFKMILYSFFLHFNFEWVDNKIVAKKWFYQNFWFIYQNTSHFEGSLTSKTFVPIYQHSLFIWNCQPPSFEQP